MQNVIDINYSIVLFCTKQCVFQGKMSDLLKHSSVRHEKSFSGSLSIVVPVFNEQESLLLLCAELNHVLISTSRLAEKEHIELIFVDDGSTDDSWHTIQQLAGGNTLIKALRFQKHSGKAAALGCGFDVARGEYIVTLDADLQDNPVEIPHIIEKLDQGYDLVCGWKRHRKDPLNKIIASRLFNFVINRATGLHLHDHNCGIKGYRRATIQDLPLHGNLHRFITMLAHSRGFSICELEVDHRPRKYGHSKFGMSRFYGAFMDFLAVLFLTANRQRRWHFFAWIGIFLLSPVTIMILILLFLFHHPSANAVSTNHKLELLAISATTLGGLSLAIGILSRIKNWNLRNSKWRRAHIQRAIGLNDDTIRLQPLP